MQKPKVSVVMAVYNDEDSVGKVLDGIINQTFQDWEFVVVNDGSDDRTPEILEEYSKKDKRIRLFHNEKNMERCFSRNRAMKEAKGEYIAINDGDDIPFPERLEKEVKYLDEHAECYLVSARAYLEDDNGKKIGESWGPKEEGDITKELEEQNRVVHSLIMFRNTGEYQYRDKFLYAQDYDLILQMVTDGKEVHMIKDFLLTYTTRKDLLYNDYLIRQTYSAEMARYIFRKKKYEGIDVYEDIDENNLEKYVPKELVLEMKMKKEFFNGNFKEARNILKDLMKEDKKFVWRYFYIDSFFGGNIHKILKTLKRKILY
jgi:glycosyltransferase involved in cell wall biosynthesis